MNVVVESKRLDGNIPARAVGIVLNVLAAINTWFQYLISVEILHERTAQTRNKFSDSLKITESLDGPLCGFLFRCTFKEC